MNLYRRRRRRRRGKKIVIQVSSYESVKSETLANKSWHDEQKWNLSWRWVEIYCVETSSWVRIQADRVTVIQVARCAERKGFTFVLDSRRKRERERERRETQSNYRQRRKRERNIKSNGCLIGWSVVSRVWAVHTIKVASMKIGTAFIFMWTNSCLICLYIAIKWPEGGSSCWREEKRRKTIATEEEERAWYIGERKRRRERGRQSNPRVTSWHGGWINWLIVRIIDKVSCIWSK